MEAASRLIQIVIAEHIGATELQADLLWHIRGVAKPGMNVALTLLPLTVCQAQGGDPCRALPVLATWLLTQIAAKDFDDLEDGQVHPVDWSAARSLNVAAALLLVVHLALDRLLDESLSIAAVRRMRTQLDQALLSACAGQQAGFSIEAGNRLVTPERWLQIAERKSGALLSWAAEAGARVAGADEATCAAYHRYGCCLGVLLQIADDYKDLWGTPVPHDLLTDELNVSVCYGLAVTQGAERTLLQTRLCSAAQGDRTAAQEAHTQLKVLGAQIFTLAAARLQQRQAVAALQSLSLDAASRRSLEDLLLTTFPALAHLP